MDLQERFQLTYVFAAHDLAVVQQIATRTAVMHLGSILEIGPILPMFAAPAHPYTAALLAAVPRAHSGARTLSLSAGEIPSPIAPPPG
jgi:peptide/nickel transport system ATP-binding protein